MRAEGLKPGEEALPDDGEQKEWTVTTCGNPCATVAAGWYKASGATNPTACPTDRPLSPINSTSEDQCVDPMRAAATAVDVASPEYLQEESKEDVKQQLPPYKPPDGVTLAAPYCSFVSQIQLKK